MVQALNSAMDVMMARDDNVVVFGEDVGYFGGVFRCTEGLQRKYGPDRAFDTPIAEAGILATAIGLGRLRFASGRGDPVCGLYLSRNGPTRFNRSAAPLSVGGRVHCAHHRTHAVRWRDLRGTDAQSEP